MVQSESPKCGETEEKEKHPRILGDSACRWPTRKRGNGNKNDKMTEAHLSSGLRAGEGFR